MDTFTNAYDEKIRPLMDKIDQARSLLSSGIDGVTFPTVVVVGDQSSGKSTLLESLSLVELPKGSGIVTRCPLVLRLRKSNQRRVYRLNNDNQKSLLDEAKLNILKYIEDETKILAGDHKNVVHDLIELLVEDPNVRDLTVVDLPGIARNPIANQPEDIHKQTTNLIRKFIKREGSVILCVFPANVDVATVESFTLAREFDPSGIRTIGVITKSDLATNNDTIIQQLLMEKPDVLKLKLGFIAVRNRSTDEKISLDESRQREKEFFREHFASSGVGSHCLGIDALIDRLADLYSDRINETFPKIRSEIQRKLKEVHDQLSKLPPNLETPSARLAKYYELADFYVENVLKIRLSSTNDGEQNSMINSLHIKFQKFQRIIDKYTRELFTAKYHTKVKNAMAACFGEQLPNFLPHPVLKNLICATLDQLWCATKSLIKDCFNEISKVLLDNDDRVCKNDILLTKLLPVFRKNVTSYLNKKKQAVHDQLEGLIRLEKQEPYTTNHYYMDKINEFKDVFTKSKGKNATGNQVTTSMSDEMDKLMFNSISNDDQAVREMLISIFSYWKVLTKRFIDYASLSLREGCVFDVCSGIRHRLRHVPIQQCDFIDSYLLEDAFIRNQRKQLQQTKERLEKVHAILDGHNILSDSNDTYTNVIENDDNTLLTIDELEQNLTGNNDSENEDFEDGLLDE
ncbi:unnamed protein product [Adineta ricciae]|uniref:Dynamin-type G domain-containing protein n=1 Tax=Adineta ricciae TaxID=249248 RepID=A0A816FR04_ADIRI|nr:unnamed protein product [Adineta ricciae]CAF1664469.1 unnamed protein product [Adineta ricciae]